MPTLGIDAKITLSTDKTRQSLDSFYRGLKVESVQVYPYAYTAGNGTVVYNLENNEATFVLFIGASVGPWLAMQTASMGLENMYVLLAVLLGSCAIYASRGLKRTASLTTK